MGEQDDSGPGKKKASAIVFYDGECGLCHGMIRFLAKRDRRASLQLAPLGGATFERTFNAGERATLPDSLIFKPSDGRASLRSDAVISALMEISGFWKGLANLLKLIPRPLRDGGYWLVARLRRRLFSRPAEKCPQVPEELRKRFLP